MNRDGYLTVAQAAEELGISQNILRRAEKKGWIKLGWRTWGDRQPMRVYRQADLPAVKTKMKAAGFTFKGDSEWIGSGEMAKLLGISETALRWREKHGKMPKAERDHAGPRRWRRPQPETNRASVNSFSK